MTQKLGYLIARTKAKTEFFTSSSSYDRPQWKGLRESTVYPTVEMAQNALQKLLKNGLAYEARLVPLAEAMTFDFPNGESITTPHHGKFSQTPGGNEYPKGDQVSNPGSPEDTGDEDDSEMTADGEGGVCSACGHEPCTCEKSDDTGHCPSCGAELDSGHDEGDGDITDDDLSNDPDVDDSAESKLGLGDEEDRPHPEEEENAFSRAKFARGQKVTYRGAKYNVESDDGTGVAVISPRNDPSQTIRVNNTALVAESASDSSSTTVDQVKFKKPAMTDAPVDFGGDASDVKVKVPANVKSDLKAKIAEFSKEAEFSNTRDDARASFLMTATEAMKTILAYLDLGTVEGVKKAQISMTSMMSPIVNHVPPSVIKFIAQGGKKSTLKDLFDAKRVEKQGS